MVIQRLNTICSVVPGLLFVSMSRSRILLGEDDSVVVTILFKHKRHYNREDKVTELNSSKPSVS